MSKGFVDLYELLEVASEAGEKELTKAYRIKALKYHPDKNRDSPEITQIFHDIKAAYDTLSDAKKRAEYDEQRRAQLAKRQRRDALSGHRKKMKTQLEADELRARQSREAEAMRARSMHDDAARFREESLREDMRRDKKMREHVQRMQQMEADDEREREERRRQANAAMEDVDELDRSIRIRWDPSEGHVGQELLAPAFAPFGEIEEIVVAPMSENGRKRGKQQSALLVFKSIAAAHALMSVQHEAPQIQRFSRFWAAGKEPDAVHGITSMAPKKTSRPTVTGSSSTSEARRQRARPDISELDLDKIPGIEMDFADFEALTLMRMRKHQQQRLAPR
ncbi:hypothetical protein IW140_001162 [Coemansia sp. RSA 1813]|nr:hypothetical protein EV178_004970 [Coemansia sp. RSA 1646]KAJ1773192.1 hypothetical protein LPJ74_000931 [Coemansia sp. RSA 1843]KAJ2092069.1 hypothetical protein IW138_001435 [Coemansia sp. RSA 986]KAJ2216595.1 hypothetical protein EV179_001134 [Coemansia sp. RSA 487]KAJ2572122.1 hypothetical protein IW140_001162 [Coemansia sp. RSA 1813]